MGRRNGYPFLGHSYVEQFDPGPGHHARGQAMRLFTGQPQGLVIVASKRAHRNCSLLMNTGLGRGGTSGLRQVNSMPEPRWLTSVMNTYSVLPPAVPMRLTAQRYFGFAAARCRCQVAHFAGLRQQRAGTAK